MREEVVGFGVNCRYSQFGKHRRERGRESQCEYNARKARGPRGDRPKMLRDIPREREGDEHRGHDAHRRQAKSLRICFGRGQLGNCMHTPVKFARKRRGSRA